MHILKQYYGVRQYFFVYRFVSERKRQVVREDTFFIGGGGGGGEVGRGFGGEGPQYIFDKLGSDKPFFILNRGRVTVFLARKKLLYVASIFYIQAKLPVKINLNYLRMSKSLYVKKLSSPN